MLNKYLIIFLIIILIVNLYYHIKLESFENNNSDKSSRNYYSLGCWKFLDRLTLPIKLNKNYSKDDCYKEAIKRNKTMFGLMNKKCYLGDFKKNLNFYKYYGGSSGCFQDGTGNEKKNLINIYKPILNNNINSGNIFCNYGCWNIVNNKAMPIKLSGSFNINECYNEAKKRDKTLFGIQKNKCLLGNLNNEFHRYFIPSDKCNVSNTYNLDNTSSTLNLYKIFNKNQKNSYIYKDNNKNYINLGCWKDKDKIFSKKIDGKHTPESCYLNTLKINDEAKKNKKATYSIFTIKNNNECYLGNMCDNKFKKYGASNECKNGRGSGNSNNVYKINGKDDFCRLGCWKDKGGNGSKPRIFNKYFGNQNNLDSCFVKSNNAGYSYFALNNNDRCFGKLDYDNKYKLYGNSIGCNGLFINKVYKSSVNNVYYGTSLYIKNIPNYLNPKSSYLGVCNGDTDCSGYPKILRNNRRKIVTFDENNIIYSLMDCSTNSDNHKCKWYILKDSKNKLDNFNSPIMYNDNVTIETDNKHILIVCDSSLCRSDKGTSVYKIFLWNPENKPPYYNIDYKNGNRHLWKIISKQGKTGIVEYGDEFVLQNQFINNPNYLNICGPSTCYNNTGKMNVNTIKEISNVFTNIWSFMKYYNYEINCESNIES